ncbi:hypothetical protein FHT08_003405 [Xanthomonas campestris]|nr:hypothetical protein [Xanthomonas sp. CFBP 8151]
MPAQRRGPACGTLTAGLAAGVLLGSLSAGAINRAFTPQEIADHAWRLPFLAGGIFCLRSVYLRRWLHETPVFAELMATRAVARETPLKLVLRDHPRSVALSLWLTWMVSAWVLVVSLMTPTLLQPAYDMILLALIGSVIGLQLRRRERASRC